MILRAAGLTLTSSSLKSRKKMVKQQQQHANDALRSQDSRQTEITIQKEALRDAEEEREVCSS